MIWVSIESVPLDNRRRSERRFTVREVVRRDARARSYEVKEKRVRVQLPDMPNNCGLMALVAAAAGALAHRSGSISAQGPAARDVRSE